ncbi:MAG: transcription termination/antitermination factor NusG [Proteobacteria bacterium]|nr:transcription termination/antitermination factor NusG [Pseudomonadota bacterium]NBX86368.1 transcription termination/antitermination factor NusG [Pseudomonadota bacterium]
MASKAEKAAAKRAERAETHEAKVAPKSGKHAEKLTQTELKAKVKSTRKPRVSGVKKTKISSKAIRDQGTRILWAPQPVAGARWYVVQTASNYEKRVQTLIREQILLQNLQRFVEDVLIPTEPIVEVKKGVKVSADRKFFPGYVLIKCNLTDDVWHVIRYTPHVTGFLGAERGKKPFPISEAEAQRILNAMAHGAEKPKSLLSFEIGETVRVKEGPFANFQGNVETIDEEKERLTVAVSIFGRATPIELDYGQVEKV